MCILTQTMHEKYTVWTYPMTQLKSAQKISLKSKKWNIILSILNCLLVKWMHSWLWVREPTAKYANKHVILKYLNRLWTEGSQCIGWQVNGCAIDYYACFQRVPLNLRIDALKCIYFRCMQVIPHFLFSYSIQALQGPTSRWFSMKKVLDLNPNLCQNLSISDHILHLKRYGLLNLPQDHLHLCDNSNHIIFLGDWTWTLKLLRFPRIMHNNT